MPGAVLQGGKANQRQACARAPPGKSAGQMRSRGEAGRGGRQGSQGRDAPPPAPTPWHEGRRRGWERRHGTGSGAGGGAGGGRKSGNQGRVGRGWTGGWTGGHLSHAALWWRRRQVLFPKAVRSCISNSLRICQLWRLPGEEHVPPASLRPCGQRAPVTPAPLGPPSRALLSPDAVDRAPRFGEAFPRGPTSLLQAAAPHQPPSRFRRHVVCRRG